MAERSKLQLATGENRQTDRRKEFLTFFGKKVQKKRIWGCGTQRKEGFSFLIGDQEIPEI